MTTFSERHGFSSEEPDITVREDAPDVLRGAVPIAASHAGLDPKALRQVVCQALAVPADTRGNWSDPNVMDEVKQALEDCDWFEVYDVIEAVCAALERRPSMGMAGKSPQDIFSHDINRVFRKNGIGWQLIAGRVEMRGSEVFEIAVREGRDELRAAGRQTTAKELHEALRDLSRRPTPEVTGAIQHGLAALECLARDVTASDKTLGAVMKDHPGLFPKPLDEAVPKIWGYASNHGRHLLEGKDPTFEEAELLVGMSGVLCRYLARKLPKQ